MVFSYVLLAGTGIFFSSWMKPAMPGGMWFQVNQEGGGGRGGGGGGGGKEGREGKGGGGRNGEGVEGGRIERRDLVPPWLCGIHNHNMGGHSLHGVHNHCLESSI